METQFLFPYRYKRIGWFILIPFFALSLAYSITGQVYDLPFLTFTFQEEQNPSLFQEDSFLFSLHKENFTNEVLGIGLLVGLILTAFSKEKIEDERIRHLRLESLLWAVYCNPLLILVAIIFIYGGLFMTVMTYSMFTPLIFFILRFNWLLWKEKKQSIQILI